MSDKIPELLNRNLQEVFGEGDATRRPEYTQKFALQHPLAFERTSLLPPRRGGPSRSRRSKHQGSETGGSDAGGHRGPWARRA